MQNISLVCLIISFMLLGCNTNSKEEAIRKYTFLMEHSDLLSDKHQNLEAEYKLMLEEHQEFKNKISTIEVTDAILLKDFAKHEVILRRHYDIIQSHQIIIASHKELKSNFDNLSPIEILVEIKEMEKEHKMMKDQYRVMDIDHKVMMREHKFMQKEIAKEMKAQGVTL